MTCCATNPLLSVAINPWNMCKLSRLSVPRSFATTPWDGRSWHIALRLFWADPNPARSSTLWASRFWFACFVRMFFLDSVWNVARNTHPFSWTWTPATPTFVSCRQQEVFKAIPHQMLLYAPFWIWQASAIITLPEHLWVPMFVQGILGRGNKLIFCSRFGCSMMKG